MKPTTFSPLYVVYFPALSEVARAHGYALTVHGTVARDLDLVACPWTEEAVDAETLAQAIAERAMVLNPQDPPTAKPHGRIAWGFALGGGAVIDLSVMPRRAPEPT